MSVRETFLKAVDPAMTLLPDKMDSRRARIQLAAIGLQESRLKHRRQIGGPARGLWQFERGSRSSRGGVWGVYLHPASHDHLLRLCSRLRVQPEPAVIYEELEFDDVLAAGVARLLLWTDPKPLPAEGDVEGAWANYLRIWRPGKPHPSTWPAMYGNALEISK